MGVRAPAAYGRAMSYSEKYRGTEWGQAVEPPPSAPQPSQGGGGGGRFMVVILGLVVVAGLAGMGAFILSQPAGPTRPVYGARNTAAPTPDRKALIASFIELTKQPGLTFHLSFDSTIQASASAVDFDAEMDIAGADQATTMTLVSGDEKVVMELVIKKGVAYGRLAGGRWNKVSADDAPKDPLASIARGVTLEYAGNERRDGDRLVHRLRSKDWLLNDIENLPGLQGASLEVVSTRFDVLVSDEGVPEEAQFSARLAMDYEGRRILVTMKGTYTFSRFGEPITIKAPKV
jgi:hypothetical protein